MMVIDCQNSPAPGSCEVSSGNRYQIEHPEPIRPVRPHPLRYDGDGIIVTGMDGEVLVLGIGADG
jgi:hypothetical protein